MEATSTTFDLPGGLINAAGDVCRHVRLRELTGADEEVLFARSTSGSARVTQFLARAIDAVQGWGAPLTEAQVAAMHLGDRDYLLLRLRQQSLGDAVHQVMRCPECSARVDVDFNISELPVRRLPDAQAQWRVTFNDITLTLRLPTGADLQAIEDLALTNPASANTRLFARLTQAVNNGPAPTEDEVRAWPLPLRAALSQWISEHAPGPDLFLDLTCPECAGDMSYTFDLAAFFLPSVSRGSNNSSKRSM